MCRGDRENTPDLSTAGDPGRWVLICKAWSETHGWMKSTKAMEIPTGCLIQVTTEHREDGRCVACAEALVFVPGVLLSDLKPAFPEDED